MNSAPLSRLRKPQRHPNPALFNLNPLELLRDRDNALN